jgi:hypothetical protein
MPTTLHLNLNYDQVKKLIDQLDIKEKEKLAEYLDDEILFKQLKDFQREMKDVPLTLDDITKEVEAVRKERYERRQKD